MNFAFSNLVYVITILTTRFLTNAFAFECPDDASISPCTCTILESHSTVECIGDGVTQKTLDDLFKILRDLNGLEVPGILEVSEFKLSSTNMTQLDLTPFLNSRIDLFYINANPQLAQIEVAMTPSISHFELGLIETDRLVIEWNPQLTNSGLGDTLTHFVGITTLFFSYNNFSDSFRRPHGDQLTLEFFPGLFNLTSLSQLYLQGNHIRELRGGQFQQLANINYLRLQNVQLERISEAAFLFDDPLNESLNVTIFLDLSLNLLTPDSFSVNSGLGDMKRPVFLDLWGNQIDTMPSSIFEPFLDAREGNSINLDSNPIICDEKLIWIKNRRAEFEMFVTAPCSNDDGENVFTSSLIA